MFDRLINILLDYQPFRALLQSRGWVDPQSSDGVAVLVAAGWSRPPVDPKGGGPGNPPPPV